MSVSTERSMAVPQVAERSLSYGMPGVRADGNDFFAVYKVATAAIARARKGDGPSLIELETYRIRGHSRSDRNRYRTKEEIENWRTLDPILRFERGMLADGILNDAGIQAVREEVEAEIAAAIAFAEASPLPDPSEVTRDVYADRTAK